MQQRESERWLIQARWDLKAARDSATAGNFEWACFQAQQAAEKAPKSFLYRAGAEPLALHSLRRLVGECEKISPEWATLRPAAELDRYYLPTRYPNGLPDDVPHEYFTAEAAEECLSLASSVIAFVERSSES
jgi:HEPN domain-containing protein